jgi:5-methylcytosine-specific restriction endonuclease McrA
MVTEFEGILAVGLSKYRRRGRCAYCGAPATSADHVVALAAGGSNGIENLVPACAFCNSSKRDRPLAEFLARRAASAVQPRNP